MRIAMFHWGFPPLIGGVETHLAVLGPELIKQGHEVSLLTGAMEGCKEEDTYKGMKIHRTTLMDLNWLAKRGLEGLEEVVGNIFANFIKKTHPQVIHAHNMNYFSDIHTQSLEKVAKDRDIPLILHAHNAWDDGVFMDLTLDINWDHIIAISYFIKDELMGIGIPEDRITVVHHGIDQKRFEKPYHIDKIYKKYPQLKGKRIIFHPARIGLAKGADASVKALHHIRKKIPKAFLILAGSKGIIDWLGSQQKDIAFIVHLIRQFNLKKNVLIDTFTLEEMGTLYQLCDLSIYPSAFGEPFGLTMLEAMAASKPMVVTDSGGMPEIIKDGINGFIVRVKDWKALGDRCVQLLQDEKLRKRMGEVGRSLVKEKYNQKVMTENMLKVYEKVLKSRR